ncbi:protein SAR DEFICIENT 1-like [Actinidia eriantha]|uniref:protein SAR DEFICIENT 1-like n=1 Tax=Actinidia eriantha TaxID=165200 RepID=UPI0025860062|nr:protein SAR DEFICIENT 1-like [Actinidia eriantha]
MAAKRYFNESEADPDQHHEKRTRTRPSFASVIGELLMVNCMNNFCSALEPMLRKVVSEEVENGLRHVGRSIIRSPSLRIQALEPSSVQLTFMKGLSLPIFTGSKIVDADNSSLQILLIDRVGDPLVWASLPCPLKVEIVVLDGDFPLGGGDRWTREDFEKNIVKERAGKRPLLTGSDLIVTMRDGYARVGEIEFTDNSSWIRSRKFRLGARVVPGSNQGVRVCEAITESFVVKDHRGELYKKHHPPMLEDEVWRLEKIGKDGVLHKKLASMDINTVQDFLKMSIVEPNKLREMLGRSEKTWDVTIKHAKTYTKENKLYICRGPDYIVFLNPICEVVKAVIGGQTFPTQALTDCKSGYLKKLVIGAYQNWNSLEEVDGPLNEMPLLTQGDVGEQYPNQSLLRSYQQHDF